MKIFTSKSIIMHYTLERASDTRELVAMASDSLVDFSSMADEFDCVGSDRDQYIYADDAYKYHYSAKLRKALKALEADLLEFLGLTVHHASKTQTPKTLRAHCLNWLKSFDAPAVEPAPAVAVAPNAVAVAPDAVTEMIRVIRHYKSHMFVTHESIDQTIDYAKALCGADGVALAMIVRNTVLELMAQELEARKGA